MSDIELVVGYATLKKANEELAKTGRVAKTTVASFNQAFSQAVTWQQKFQAEQGRVNASLNKHYLESQKSNKSAKESAAAFMSEAKELERLNSKFVAGYRAMDLYSKELNDLAMAHSKGVISAEQQAMAIEGLNRDMAAGIGIFSGMGSAAGNTRNKMNSTGMAVQQLGYQMGDFAVQVQSGQSAFVAFSQQATQLVGILPMVASQLGLTMKMAIGLSAGLGVAIPIVTAVAGVLWRMGDSSEDAADSQKTLKESIDATLESVRKAQAGWEEFQAGLFSGETDFVANLDEAAQNLRLAKEALAETTKAELAGIGAAGGIDLGGLLGWREEVLSIKDATDGVSEAQAKYNEFLMLSVRESEQFAANQSDQIRDRLTLLRVEQEYGADSLELRRASFLQDVAAFEVAQEKEGVNTVLIQQMVDMLHEEENLKLEMIATQEATEAFLAALFSVDFSNAIAGATTLSNKMASAAGSAWEILKANAQRIEAGRKLPLDNLAAQYSQYGAGRRSFDEEASSKRYSADSTYDGFTTSIPKAKKSGGSSGRKSKRDAQQTLQQITDEMLATAKLADMVGLEGEQLRMVADIRKQLGDTEKKYSEEAIRASADRIVAYEMAQEALEKAQAAQEDLANDMSSTMGDAFSDWIDGTKSFKDAFRDMADDIIKQLFDILVVQKLVGNFNASTGSGSGIAGLIGPMLGGMFADGAAFNKGSVVPFATGGVVSSATMFPMSGGKSGVMGEAGPEAIMPLTRGADGKLGVKASGGGSSGGTTISISVDARGAQVGVAEQIDVKLRALAPKLVAQSVKTTKRSMMKTKSGWA